jgi:(R,R)-butanediol dehydrogenase / meso-butanediol dehydrogenase / diacetyl reductase
VHAVVYTSPGSLELREVPEPSPGEGQVLLQVGHLGICGSDLLIWEGGLGRVRPPVVLGHEFSGTVLDANGAPGVEAGRRVAVEPLLNCGRCRPCASGQYHACRRLGLIGIDVDGAAAPLVAVPAHRLHPLPDSLSLRDAALAEPTAVAVHMTRRAGVTLGDRVAVLGGGPVGAIVALVCRAAGVEHLVVSEPNPSRRSLLADLGFAVFDPIHEDVASLVEGTDGEGFDVVFEITGVPAALATSTELARVQGTVLLGGLPARPLPLTVATAVLKELTLRGSRVYSARDMAEAIRLLDRRAVPADRLVTREVALTDAIPDAYERLRASPDDMKILITT